MIDVKELRIGNLLQENSDEAIILEITEISKNGHVKFIPIDGSQIPMIGGYVDVQTNPIPLTEEWLKKFGFEVIGLQGYWHHMEESFTIYHNSKTDIYDQEINHEYSAGIPLKYVHELQNRFQSITGKELQITH